MKKSLTIIGKLLLEAVMFLAGFLAFCYMVGEPTEEWYEWSRTTFGVFSGLWFIIEKLLAGGAIALLVKLYEKLEPNAFKSDDEVEPKAVEE